MARVSFQKVNVQDRTIEQLQANIERALQSIDNSHIITGVRLTAGKVNKIPTELGNLLTEYTVVRQNAQSNIWESQTTNNSKDKLLYLECSADVTVDIKVA